MSSLGRRHEIYSRASVSSEVGRMMREWRPAARASLRSRPITLAVEARRLLEGQAARRSHTGRIWLNGHELGRRDPRFTHLGETYD